MPTITPEMTGTLLIVTIVMYLITLAYSVYMAVLNHKQAKVKDVLHETNKILESIDNRLKEVSNGKKI